MKVEIKEEKDFKKIFQVADKVEAELTKLDTITPCFIAYDEKGESIGIIGFRTGFNGYWVFDLVEVAPGKKDSGIEEKLVEFAKEHARKNGIRVLYMTMSDRWAAFLKKAGASEIKMEELPKDFYSTCLVCKIRGKECFPVAMKLDI